MIYSATTAGFINSNSSAQKLDMKELMTNIVKVVNFVRFRGLNHEIFKTYMEEIGSEYENVTYFLKVRWLSKAAILKRFQLLIPEIKQFMQNKKQNIGFLENEKWFNGSSFFLNITKMLAEFNLQLQEKN